MFPHFPHIFPHFLVHPCPVPGQGDHAQTSPSDGEEDVLGPRVLAVLVGADDRWPTTAGGANIRGTLGIMEINSELMVINGGFSMANSELKDIYPLVL